jgi:protein-S-isoprenylcysteine O-methyltransferase Ste14
MRALESRIPPVAVVLFVALVMWVISRVFPAFEFDMKWREPIAVCFAIAGAVTSIAGVLSFRRAGTTVNPTKVSSPSSLVVSGVYRLTRNPMYLGFLLILAAWAVFLSNGLAWLMIPAFELFINRFQIQPEERALTTLFPHEFPAYRLRVRRWL